MNLWMGDRIAETRALRWKCIDWETGVPLACAEALKRISDAQFRHRPGCADEARWSRQRQDQFDLQPCGRQLAESCIGGHLAKSADGNAETATAEGGATNSAPGLSSGLK